MSGGPPEPSEEGGLDEGVLEAERPGGGSVAAPPLLGPEAAAG